MLKHPQTFTVTPPILIIISNFSVLLNTGASLASYRGKLCMAQKCIYMHKYVDIGTFPKLHGCTN